MSKIVKAIDVEVNKRLEEYLVTFIKYNYENGTGQNEGFVRPSDEEIEGHISSYVKMTPFSLEEKVVEKKRMGRPKKNEKETVLADKAEMFGNLPTEVSELKLEHPNDIAPVVDAAKPVKEKKEKVIKEKKEKVVKEKVEKAPKEKKEKVVKEKVEKAPKEKKAKVTNANKKGDEEEENPWAIEDDGVAEGAKKKVVKEKKEKVVKEKVEKAPKAAKEGGEGGVKKRGRPKKGDVKVEEQVEKANTDDEESEEEEVENLAVELQELCVVAIPPAVKTPAQQSAKHNGQQDEDDDDLAMEDYEEEEEASTPKTDPQEHIVKFTDRASGKDYFIDKQMKVENEDEPDKEWYAVKDAATRQVVGRSNLQKMEIFADDEDDDEDDDEEEEEEEEEEDADDDDDDEED